MLLQRQRLNINAMLWKIIIIRQLKSFLTTFMCEHISSNLKSTKIPFDYIVPLSTL